MPSRYLISVPLLTAIAAIVGIAPALAAPYEYTVIATTGDEVREFLFSVGINNSGEVAYAAFPHEGEAFLLVNSSAGPLKVLVSSQRDELSGISSPVLNDAAQVAFFATSNQGGNGIFLADESGVRQIVNSDGPVAGLTFPSLNHAGQIAYGGQLRSTGADAVFLSEADQQRQIFQHPAPQVRQGLPSLNDAGHVAFPSRQADGVTRMMLYRDGTVSVVAEPNEQFFSLLSPNIAVETRPILNNRDEVAFYASLHTTHEFGRDEAIFVQGVDGLRKVAQTSADGPYNSLFSHDMNDHGIVAFTAGLIGDTFETGIFTGPDPVRDAVIRTGDALDGAFLQYTGAAQINNHGQIAFLAGLSDGRSVIVLVNPVPEPGTRMLGAIAAVTLLVYRRQLVRKALQQPPADCN